MYFLSHCIVYTYVTRQQKQSIIFHLKIQYGLHLYYSTKYSQFLSTNWMFLKLNLK
uniref:Uncharacterized protein n=1 Tax=Lepeophtheirus salmonis TaxID=72036 RepID=A0A0K2TA80_LEPSM